mgnify:CR=1 FL=1
MFAKKTNDCILVKWQSIVNGGKMIQKAEVKDLTAIAELACRLWPHHTVEEMRSEYADNIAKPDVAFFLAYVDETAIGFAQCQLRHDYVEGTESAPVGYLEGIFVAEQYRKQGTAKALLTACEDWARTKGCTEFASDCELTNIQMYRIYIEMYLRSHPNVNPALDIIVTQKEATAYGLPIEVYFFTREKAWSVYEKQQSDIFDHLMTIAPVFGLRLYQRP